MSRTEQKRRTRQRILDAAGRVFRQGGFGGVGVDGLAKEAGVTSGAFYVHFDSKANAFRETVAQGMAELKHGVRSLQATHGRTWWSEFVRFYLGAKRTCELPQSCVLQSLSPEMARSDELSRAAFEAELVELADIVIQGPAADDAPRDAATALSALSALVGTVTLARAVADPAVAGQMAAATERLLLPTHYYKKGKLGGTTSRKKRK